MVALVGAVSILGHGVLLSKPGAMKMAISGHGPWRSL